MTRQAVAVPLSNGTVEHVLVQTGFEYLDMHDELATASTNEELPKKDRVKRGFAIKFYYRACTADGARRFCSVDEAFAFASTLTMRDIKNLAAAGDAANAMTDEAVDDTEKK